MLSETLKQETKENHQLLEKKLVAYMRSVKSVSGYANLLGIFYSYFSGLEVAMNKGYVNLLVPDYAERRKTVALLNDLAVLEAPAPDLASEHELPAITNEYQALGALYVIEGSTLGGSVIGKMMKVQLPSLNSLSLSYFHGYGNDTMPMWESFKLVLNNPLYEPKHDIIIQAANDTFLKFSQFFDKNQ